MNCQQTYSKFIIELLLPCSEFVSAADALLQNASEADVLSELFQLFQSQPELRYKLQTAMIQLLTQLNHIFRNCQQICSQFEPSGNDRFAMVFKEEVFKALNQQNADEAATGAD